MMTDESDVYICGICKKEFQDFVTFLQHKSNFGVFKCKLCNLSYHDREDIQKHINSSHANQKVDVAFTIPTKASIVSTKSETIDTNETPKSGYALSVYTCRLCNRFTLVEKTMLQHLQIVHKIHVVPGSVELAALMLCSKPLDTANVPKLTTNPVLVKTVTTPSIAKPSPAVTSAGVQTSLATASLASFASRDVAEQPNSNDACESGLFGCWRWFSEDRAAAADDDACSKDAEVPPQPATAKNGPDDDKKNKMTSILKATTAATAPLSSSEEGESVKTDVCIDGGHDYVSMAEIPTGHETEDVVVPMVVQEEGCCVEEEEATSIVLADAEVVAEEEFSASVEPAPPIGSPICLVENVVSQDDGAIVIATEQLAILKAAPTSILYAKSPATKTNSPSLPPKILVRKIKTPKPLLTSKQKKAAPVISLKTVLKGEESGDEEENLNEEEDAGEEEEAAKEDPQPGPDGMYHCQSCKRAFARERQFKAHMSIHVMYGEHYMESPSSNRLMFGDSKGSQRKRQKMQ